MPTGCVFISYRRGADNNAAGRLHDRLETAFGRDRLFIDVDAIPPGVDFVEYLNDQVAGCEAFLAIIGKGWLEDLPRLQNPADFVRVEIEAALARPRIPIIPVLVDARMPTTEELPESLHPLVRRNAVDVPHLHFAAAVDRRLVPELKKVLGEVAGASTGGGRDGAQPARARSSREVQAAVSTSITLGRVTLAIGLAASAALAVRYGAELAPAGRSAIEQLTGGDRLSSREAAQPASGRSPVALPVPPIDGRDHERADKALEGAETLAAATAGDPPPAGPSDPPACAAGLAPLASCRDCPECPKMIVIPAGMFLMGSPEDEWGRDDDEGPQHKVRIESFALAQTEVTFDQWQACVNDGGCESNPNPDDYEWGRGDRPVINVSWDDAKEYIAWLNTEVEGEPYRLPSEAEWEYAARAGTTTPFAFGETISTEQANYDGNYAYGPGEKGKYRGEPVPVDELDAANAWYLRHMHGNASEWVEDCWHGNYLGAPHDGSAWLLENGGDCSYRVVRGGARSESPIGLRSASRGLVKPETRSYFGNFNSDLSFRPARTLVNP